MDKSKFSRPDTGVVGVSTNMRDILDLVEISAREAARAGGKALRCAEMRRAQLPIPDGVVVAADAELTASVHAALRRRLLRFPPNSLFAVRSSAAHEDGAQHSFAGMHDTRLNVTLDNVAGEVESCRASVSSERALAYREARRLFGEDMRTAVFVQLMIPAVSAGVVFTRNPVNGAEEIVIDAAAGLGETLVSGTVDPDEWHVRKSDTAVRSFRSGRDENIETDCGPVLTDPQVRELSALAVRIENLFGAPQDIEWCHDGRQFWIVQSRPITGVGAGSAAVEWSRANLREVLPDLPAPQVSDFVREVLNSGMKLYGGRIYPRDSKLGPPVEVFFGRPYFNLSLMRHVYALVGTPAAQFLRAIGCTEILPEDELVPPLNWRRLLVALPDLIRMTSYQFHLAGMMRKYLSRLAKEVEFTRRLLAAGIDERTMWAHMKSRYEQAPRELFPVFALSNVMMLQEQLRKLLERVRFRSEDLVPPILAAGGKSVSSQQAFDLLRLATAARAEAAVRSYFAAADTFDNYRRDLADSEFLRRFDRFLAIYGHRGHYETDWSRPCYAEDPAPLLAAIQSHVNALSCPSAEAIIDAQDLQAQEAWARFEASLSRSQRMTVRPAVQWLLRRIKQMLVWRELYRSELTRVAAVAREWHLCLARKLIARGLLDATEDYFLLTYSEIGAAIEGRTPPAGVRKIIDQRKADMARWRALDMPLMLHPSDLALIATRRPEVESEHAAEFTGLCISPGVADAEVVVLLSPAEFARMKRGAIIVAPATDPSWTPLFTQASGLIVEIGGLLSHAATVAREYGLPALANVRHATKLLKNGDRVHLDATAGRAVIM